VSGANPFDPTPFLEPERCAVIVFECQQMVIGEHGPYPGLVASVRGGMLDRLAGLLDDAREVGAAVVYCTISGRPGSWGSAKTPMLDRAGALGGDAGTPAAVDRSIVPELQPGPDDVIVDRTHGMSGFHGTELDTCLRAMGVETVIPTGVSANVGVIGTSIEALNHGYRLVVATDCIAADPPEFGEQMMRYSYRNIAYLSTSGQIAQIWRDRTNRPLDP
jgi:nicotinamidase-related amidase